MTRVFPIALALACLFGPGLVRARDIRPEWPQVKADRVDASDPGRWRVFVTALGEGGLAIPLLERALDLYLARGGEAVHPQGASPLTRFDRNVAAKGFGGTIRVIGKADASQAVVIVIASHSDVAPDIRAVLLKAVGALLKGLRKDARVAVILYGDVIQVLWSPDGQRADWRDLDEYQHCLGRLRLEAAGEGPEGPALPCGRLADGPETVQGWLQTLPPGQGLFPRLFGIRESDDVRTEAERRGHTMLERRRADEAVEPFAAGAVEAAMRLLMAGSDPEADRLVLLLSDGRDGYLRVADLAGDRVSRSRACTEDAAACAAPPGGSRRTRTAPADDHEGGSPQCTRQTLECAIPRVANILRKREDVVREYLLALVPRLRAAEVRVHAIALPGTDEVGAARLQALALKTGGTYRAAGNVALIEKGAARALAEELASQVVVVPPSGLDPEQEYSVAVALGGEERIASAPYRFRTGARVFFFERPIARARAWVLSKLGHTWGPPVFWTALVLGVLMALALVWTLGKGIVGLGKWVAKKGGAKAPKAPKPPGGVKVPTLKRPGK